MVNAGQVHPVHRDEGAAWWDSQNPLNDKQKAVFLDWIEQGMDFFGCDENVPKKVFGTNGEPLRIPQQPYKEVDLHGLDYAKLHDQLLESLMAEQSKKASEGIATDFDSSASSFSFSNSSFNSQMMNTSMNSSTINSSFDSNAAIDDAAQSEGGATANSKRGHKRPRALKLHRRVMPALSRGPPVNERKQMMKRQLSSNSSVSSTTTTASTTPRESTTKRSRPGSDAVPVSLSDLSELEFPPAATFIHPQCRLQKDKGKGEPAGSNTCAKGRELCLMKLEQKMALLTRVAFGEESKNKGTADMKRRPARVAEVLPNFTETRSVIELRMGFMSMQYGILLRWDTSRTGKVTLVVLRKMCHESFYSKCKVPSRKPLATKKTLQQQAVEPPSYAVRNVVNGNHAILQRAGGMEVALLEPPYRVDRPDDFEPSLLSVAVQQGSGLRRKSNWTVQLSYDGKTENILLTWDSGQSTFTPKLGDKLKHEIPIDGSLDLPALEVRLFEHRKRKPRKCVGQMHVPLLDLEAQSSSQESTPSYMKVVCSHDPGACVTLCVLLESDYALWLRKELEARRREEVNTVVWKSPFRAVADVYSLHAEEDDEEDSLWEWLCNAC